MSTSIWPLWDVVFHENASKLFKCRVPTTSMCLGQPGLTGRRFMEPRKLVLLILFGFEVDVLEIALKQQQDLVDKIFLVESTSTHRGVGLEKFRLSEIKSISFRQQNH